jgi:short-subunit dehydrogenase
MKSSNSSYALITGASEGIGKAISIELARKGYHQLLVALPDGKLQQHAQHLREEYSIKADTLGIDLTETDADNRIAEWIESNNYKVQLLVNNAGYGYLGSFDNFDRDFYRKLLQININTVVGLTRLLLENLKSHKRSYILNVGSIASFYPMPYKIVYAASKYFIFSFSRALREELKRGPVSVSLLCPGPVRTNPGVMERINAAGKLGRISSISAEQAAHRAVKRLLNGRWLATPGFSAKLYYFMEKITPGFIKQAVLARGFRTGKSSS